MLKSASALPLSSVALSTGTKEKTQSRRGKQSKSCIQPQTVDKLKTNQSKLKPPLSLCKWPFAADQSQMAE